MSSIKLLLADVDGTLVTHEKVLTPRAIASIQGLSAAGIACPANRVTLLRQVAVR